MEKTSASSYGQLSRRFAPTPKTLEQHQTFAKKLYWPIYEGTDLHGLVARMVKVQLDLSASESKITDDFILFIIAAKHFGKQQVAWCE